MVTNLVVNPGFRAAVWNNEWLARYGMAGSKVVGASDGPTPGLSTYMRNTQVTAVTGTGRGVDHLNNTEGYPPAYDASRLEWPVTAGSPITISVYTRASVVNNNLFLVTRIHDGAGTWLANAVNCKATNYATANVWVRLACTITPSVSGYLAFGSRYNQSVTWPVGATIDETGLMVTSGSTIYNYSDPVTNSSWVWNGAVDGSTSTGPAS